MATQKQPRRRAPLKLVKSPSDQPATGRKTKATMTTLEKICEALRMGATHKLAAQYAGIHESTFYDYMKLPEFAEAIGTAESGGAIDLLTMVKQLASSQDEAVALRAATWILERRFPEMYGRNVVVNEHHGEQQIRVIMDSAWRGEPQVIEAVEEALPQIGATASNAETVETPSVRLTFEGDGQDD